MMKSLGPNTIVHPHPVLIVGTYDDNGKPNIGFWDDPKDFASWKVKFPKTGTYQVSGRFAGPKASTFQVLVGRASLEAKSPATTGFGSFETVDLGSIKVAKKGVQEVQVVPVPLGWSAVNLSFLAFRKSP